VASLKNDREMKKIVLLITTILTFNQVLQAQKLDKNIIDKRLELKNDAIYIVNGLTYEQKDSLKFNKVLKSHSIDRLVELTKLRNDGRSVRCANNDIVIIYFATQQSENEIKMKLNEIRDKFPDEYYGFSQHILTDSKNPVLMVDNKTIHHTDSKKIIENLNTSNIIFIDYKSEPQASEIYGQNAKNGLIRIWTKQK